jgi:hypothetical protein
MERKRKIKQKVAEADGPEQVTSLVASGVELADHLTKTIHTNRLASGQIQSEHVTWFSSLDSRRKQAPDKPLSPPSD